MEDRLNSFYDGYSYAVYNPNMAPRLRSVIASAGGSLSNSVEYDWRGNQTLGLPVGGENAYGYFKQPSLSYSRFACEDYSEEDSDKDLDASSTSSAKVRVYSEIEVNLA